MFWGKFQVINLKQTSSFVPGDFCGAVTVGCDLNLVM